MALGCCTSRLSRKEKETKGARCLCRGNRRFHSKGGVPGGSGRKLPYQEKSPDPLGATTRGKKKNQTNICIRSEQKFLRIGRQTAPARRAVSPFRRAGDLDGVQLREDHETQPLAQERRPLCGKTPELNTAGPEHTPPGRHAPTKL